MMTWGEGIRSFANSRPAVVGLNRTEIWQDWPGASVLPAQKLEAATSMN